jgi:hypothetical protein
LFYFPFFLRDQEGCGLPTTLSRPGREGIEKGQRSLLVGMTQR